MTGAPPFLVPPDVGWTSEPDDAGRPRVYVAPLPRGPVAVLAGTAALTWLAAVEGADDLVDEVADDLVDEVADITGHPPQAVREDVEPFIEDLLARGLLVRPENLSTRRPGR